ncbi:MAG TPA: phasin family protein [Casimicrobiaceae bacterium]|nr:phasin family protein [Casimicrobiaceae bacterium]
MLKAAAGSFNTTRVRDAALFASRQVWLAGLGAATVTRQWAVNDAGEVFRSLVKEGAVVEGRARRIIGKQVGNSFALATGAWNSARHSALTTVNGWVDAAAAALPRLRTPAIAKGAAKASRSPAKARKARTARRSARKTS